MFSAATNACMMYSISIQGAHLSYLSGKLQTNQLKPLWVVQQFLQYFFRASWHEYFYTSSLLWSIRQYLETFGVALTRETYSGHLVGRGRDAAKPFALLCTGWSVPTTKNFPAHTSKVPRQRILGAAPTEVYPWECIFILFLWKASSPINQLEYCQVAFSHAPSVIPSIANQNEWNQHKYLRGSWFTNKE